ncbi:MAG: SpoIIIAH-like family protein [Bacilli bacterium]|nr:SpoIIIAH-like family protein [Bacilli bacterium]
MLKKNQLALILLTLVLMLTVYYITDPFEKEKGPPEEIPEETTGRIEELTAQRLALREERNLVILGLDAIIASNDTTIVEKENALTDKRYLNNLTEKELILELEVINKGYRDCFVHASDLGVEITIVADEHSNSTANEILIQAAMVFGLLDSANVVINFKTAQQVMGEVS